MDRLLKPKNNTIHRLIHSYRTQTFILFCFLILSSLGAYAIAAGVARQENQWLFDVNGFYTGLQEENKLLYRIMTGQGQEDYAEAVSKADGLMENLYRMEKYPISPYYRRDILDLENMMRRYLGNLSKLHQLSMDSSSPGTLTAAWSEMNRLFQAMDGTFETVFQQISDACASLDARMGRLQVIYMVLLAATIALLSMYMHLKTRQIEQSIAVPIQQLEDELAKVDLQTYVNAEPLSDSPLSCDDIRTLVQVYNAMLQKLNLQLRVRDEYHQTMLQLQEQELLNLQISNDLKKAQLSNLQSQINPHFLFNTLNMISQTAYMENAGRTIELLSVTGDLLRYALDYSDKSVPLSKEVEILGNYVYLQEQRFGERIRFVFDLDESFFSVQVPNLILQPLVENAIQHGINMYQGGGEIIIRSRYLADQEMGQVSIIDNGAGLEADELSQVVRRMRSGRIVTGKDGLSNVYLRLSLFFDYRSDIRITSSPGEGTEVALLIPCKEAGADPEDLHQQEGKE